MKKIMMVICSVTVMLALSLPGYCDTLITPVSGSSYTNPTTALSNSNTDSEEQFLEDILGLTYNDASVYYVTKIEAYFLNADYKSLTNWSPGFSWDFAIVKVDGDNDGWYAYQDDGDDDLLSVGTFRYGISHITLFSTTAVPEPSILILLGTGLLGIVGIKRRK